MRPAKRGINITSNRRRLPSPNLPGLRPLRSYLSDRRRWRPEPIGFRSALTIGGRRAIHSVRPVIASSRPQKAKSKLSPSFPMERRVFSVPKRVEVCVRRKERREVLFAKRRTGRGSRTPKRRNEWSDVKCR